MIDFVIARAQADRFHCGRGLRHPHTEANVRAAADDVDAHRQDDVNYRGKNFDCSRGRTRRNAETATELEAMLALGDRILWRGVPPRAAKRTAEHVAPAELGWFLNYRL